MVQLPHTCAMCVSENVSFQDFKPSYAEWKSAKGGVFNVSVAEIVSFVEQAFLERVEALTRPGVRHLTGTRRREISFGEKTRRASQPSTVCSWACLMSDFLTHPEARAEMRESFNFYEARLNGLGSGSCQPSSRP